MADKLTALAEKIRTGLQQHPGARVPESLNFIMLADFLAYNLRQGGFAQLLYNAGGAYLAEMEEVLLAAAATVTHRFYTDAVLLCTRDIPLYHAFLESDYTSDNALKNELQLLSIRYFQTGADFVAEAEAYIDNAAVTAGQWLRELES